MNCLNKSMTEAKFQQCIRAETVRQMKTYQLETEALWLRAIAIEFGFGKQRLERLYKRFYELRKNDKHFYETSGYNDEDVIPCGAINELSEMGVDIRSLFNEYGEMLVDTRFSEK